MVGQAADLEPVTARGQRVPVDVGDGSEVVGDTGVGPAFVGGRGIAGDPADPRQVELTPRMVAAARVVAGDGARRNTDVAQRGYPQHGVGATVARAVLDHVHGGV